MKKSTRIMLIISICLISVGIIFSAVGIAGNASWRKAVTGGMWDTMLFISDDYDNTFREDGTYRIDSSKFDTLKINWYEGNINIRTYQGSDIILKETSKTMMNENNCLRYKIEDSTLQVDSCSDGAAVSFSGNSERQNKNLTVLLPEKKQEKIDYIMIYSTYSDITAKNLTLKKFFADTDRGYFIGKNLKTDSIELSIFGDCKADFRTCPKDFFYSTGGNCFIGLPKDSNADVTFDVEKGQVYNEFGRSGRHRHGRIDDDTFFEGQMKIGRGGRNSFDIYTGKGDIRLCRGSCF